MLKSHLETLQGLTNCVGEIEGITRAITTAYRNGKKLILAGNGGSAADALHIAGELTGRFAYKRPALPMILTLTIFFRARLRRFATKATW